MIKITHFGYDRYELNHDLGSGELIDSRIPQGFKGTMYKSIGGCLKAIARYLGTQYHRCDWCFEEDLDCKGNGGWVLHIIVERDSMKFATHDMIEKWKKSEKPELIDLLVNVFIEKC